MHVIIEASLAAALASAQASLPIQPAGERPIATPVNDASIKWGPCPPIFPKGCEIAVLQGDPSKPNSDIFLRVPGGYEIPPHGHTSAERMILVTGQLRVKYQGAPAATLAPGSYAYGPAKLPHRATWLGAQACTLFIAFEGRRGRHAVHRQRGLKPPAGSAT